MTMKPECVGYDGKPLHLTNPDDGLYWFDAPAFSITRDTHRIGCRDENIYLITTSEGHIMIDTGFGNGSEYFTLCNIIDLGFNPKDIKYIILTHKHPDHIGGAKRLKELTGAKIIAHKTDAYSIESGYIHILPNDGSEWPIYGCEIDHRLTDDYVLEVGDKRISILHTPGHTAGCLSILWNIEIEGKEYCAGLTGICGEATLYDLINGKREFPAGESPSDYHKSIDKLLTQQVNVFLASHSCDNNGWGKYEELKKGKKPNPFIDPKGWENFLKSLDEKISLMENGIDVYEGKGWFGVKKFEQGFFGPQ